MIEVHYRKGRLGNRLFRYAIGRILAEEMGYRLSLVDNFFGRIVPHRAFSNTHDMVEGKVYHAPVEEYKQEIYPNKLPKSLREIITDSTPRKLQLHGWYQRTEYYEPYIDRIKVWFELPKIDVSPDDIILHIRRGDYLGANIAIKLKYYTDILDKALYRRVYIIGEGLDLSVYKTFKRYDPIYPRGSEIEDFNLMKNFNKIVMSNSTFAWWAAYLSSAQEVYYPVTPKGFFSPLYSKETGQDLRVNRKTYRQISGVKYVRKSPIDLIISKFLRHSI